jgi:hypothetical protein
MAWNDETENYVDTMDRELLSRRAQNILRSLVANGGVVGTPVTWASRPTSPTVGDRIVVTDVHPSTPVEFLWNGTAWIPTSPCPSVREVYVQPSDGSNWASRPNNLAINIPVWANTLQLSIAASGSGGGSGRRGAATTARSGGQGGAGGSVAMFSIPLRAADGSLVAASGSLLLPAGTLGGAAVSADDTAGAASGGASQNSNFTFGAGLYRAPGGGVVAAGGNNVALNDSSANLVTALPAANAWGRTSITAAITANFPSACSCSGGGGGSISTGDAVLGVGTVQHVGRSEGNIAAPGAIGSYEVLGNLILSRPPLGGAAVIGGTAGTGGIGLAGCGGGGGGASVNGQLSGAGGRGGDGWAIFIWE